jgi:Heparinase II/III-like protein/Heparinase II/III N-terminus
VRRALAIPSRPKTVSEANAATWLRTLVQLRPLHVAMRPPAMVARRLARNVPSVFAPEVVERWPSPPNALVAHANAERARGAEHIARLTQGSALRAYEEVYGLELGADDAAPHGDWSGRVAIAPFPASVRARRIAVAIRLGRSALRRELARAARAIALQPELHILGNHLLENGFGLVCAGAAARGPEADAWWSLGCAILAWQLPRQFLADGAHFERSVSYHLALTAALLEAIEISDASGRHAPRSWRDVAAKAVTWALDVRAPDGGYPLFNDAALDAAPSIDSVAALARAVGVAAEASPSRSAIARIEPTGWLRMRAPDGAWLVVDAGPDGPRDQPGHAHADGLTFELWARGRRLVVDYGVASYADDEARRTTRATRSHNTVEVDRTDSCEVWGAFRLGRRGRGEIVRAESMGDRSVAELTHDGYTWMRGPPRHRRTLTLSSGRLEILDRIDRGSKPFVSRLRLDEEAARGIRVTRDGAPLTGRSDVWYPRHAEPRAALVFEAAAAGADAISLAIDW